ncbi:MAG: hypothetical protein QG648_85 [Patescibacteria group bacterium]|nr:hypothetical protein [Patescibacteria group bacterium]
MIKKEDLHQITEYLWEIPKSFNPKMLVPARFYASQKLLNEILQDKSLEQLVNVCSLKGIQKYGLALPDIHEGYASPIGGVAALKVEDGVISPGMQGYDINCGMRILTSPYQEKEIRPYLERLVDQISRDIPSGLGQGRETKLTLTQLDKILEGGAYQLVKEGYGDEEDLEYCEAGGYLKGAEAGVVSDLAKKRGQAQLGTLGAGNHFLEIQVVNQIFQPEIAQVFGLFLKQVVLMIHTGSRGLGHQVATDYIKEFLPLSEKYYLNLVDPEFACVPFQSPEGQACFKASQAAANYAWANRQLISYYLRKAWQKVLGERDNTLQVLYDVAHNIIKLEEYQLEGKKTLLAVHRKGATRSFPPGHPEIPLKYRAVGQPVLIPGSMGSPSYVLSGTEEAEASFYSACHGAGRVMSRHQALKKISGQELKQKLSRQGILVKVNYLAGLPEEAPWAYKDINEVVEVVTQAGLAQKVAELKPLAVIKG